MIYHESYFCPKCNAYRRPEEVLIEGSGAERKVSCKECGMQVRLGMDKMSKSKLNIVTPDYVCSRYGADTARIFILFIGPPDQDAEWSPQGVEGVYRFLNRLWRLVIAYKGDYDPDWRAKLTTDVKNMLDERQRALRRKVHQTVRKVTEDIEGFHFNTAVAAMMELLNDLQSFVAKMRPVDDKAGMRDRIVLSEALNHFCVILHPFAPHITDELWEQLGHTGSVYQQAWCEYDADATREEQRTIVIQVNGKVRDKILVPVDISEDELRERALAAKGAQTHIAGKKIKRIIVVPNRLVNIVV